MPSSSLFLLKFRTIVLKLIFILISHLKILEKERECQVCLLLRYTRHFSTSESLFLLVTREEAVKGGIIYDHCLQSFPPCLSTSLQLNISSTKPLILLLLNQQNPPCGQFLSLSFINSLVELSASAVSHFLHLVSYISYSISPSPSGNSLSISVTTFSSFLQHPNLENLTT